MKLKKIILQSVPYVLIGLLATKLGQGWRLAEGVNAWDIVMGIFDLAQTVVNNAAGVIISDTSLDLNSVITDMEARLMEMDIGPLFSLWIQSALIGILSWILTICIFIIVYGRMIEIYTLTVSVRSRWKQRTCLMRQCTS